MMGRPPKVERNKEIVEKIDQQGKTFREVAKHYNLVVSTVHEAYTRTKQRKTVGEIS